MTSSLSPPDPSLGPTLPQHLAAACLAFGDDWREGRRPRIEEVLERTRPFDRTTLLSQLIRIEVRHRVQAGETPHPDEYIARFPDSRNTIGGIDWDSLTPQAAARAARSPVVSTIVTAPLQRAAVGRFELVERLGVGGFGEVWRAFDSHLQREVAVKIGHFDAGDHAQAELLLHEARSAARLRHPRIVPIHEAAAEGDIAYIVSDYIPGMNLAERLKSGAMPRKEAAALVLKLAEAVAHAHDRGIVHRDIKPANVLLDLAGEPHLTDFGVARRTAGDKTISHAGQALGTPAYMSPEQAKGDTAAVDPRTDVYALGLVLYELLAGRRAYPGDAREALKAVLLGPPPPVRTLRKDVPRDLATIVEVATARERSDRYATAAALAEDLGRYLLDEHVLARPVGRIEKGWRWLRRRPVKASAALAAAAATVSLASSLPWRPPGETTAPGESKPPLEAAAAAGESPADLPWTEDSRMVAPRTVVIDSEPAGATVWLFGRDPGIGLVRAKEGQRIDVPGVTPAQTELMPGEYLVVARLPNGDWNEVWRRVPEWEDSLPGSYANLAWSTDQNDRVHLTMPIPPAPAPGQFVEFPGQTLVATVAGFRRRVRVPPYALCRREFSVADYLAARPAILAPEMKTNQPPGDRAINLRFDEAMDAVELVGLRLPDEFEWEVAALWSPPEWQEIATQSRAVRDFGPVGTPAADVSGPPPGVIGLRSNVSEWVFSLTFPPRDDIGPTGLGGRRIIKGATERADWWNAPASNPGAFDLTERRLVGRIERPPGVGFRGARSIRPRYVEADFLKDLGPAGTEEDERPSD